MSGMATTHQAPASPGQKPPGQKPPGQKPLLFSVGQKTPREEMLQVFEKFECKLKNI